jgi:hypothetical protein
MARSQYLYATAVKGPGKITQHKGISWGYQITFYVGPVSTPAPLGDSGGSPIEDSLGESIEDTSS